MHARPAQLVPRRQTLASRAAKYVALVSTPTVPEKLAAILARRILNQMRAAANAYASLDMGG